MSKVLISILSLLFFASSSFAAGSWSAPVSNISSSGIIKLTRTFTADASAATIPSLPAALPNDGYIAGWDGCITGIEYVPDGTTPADSVLVVVSTPDGAPLPGLLTSAVTEDEDPTWVRPFDEQPVCITGGIAISVTTNTTNSAVGEINFYGFKSVK